MDKYKEKNPIQRVSLATELYITTKEKPYADFLVTNKDGDCEAYRNTGWMLGRVLPMINDAGFINVVTSAVKSYADTVKCREKQTPLWNALQAEHSGGQVGIFSILAIINISCTKAFQGVVSDEYMLDALNFVLGCHPGSNTSSFASGVGAHSAIPGYGFNRADWSYIPGGVVSGTALIRPDFRNC